MKSGFCVQTASWMPAALLTVTSVLHAQAPLVEPRRPNGDGSVAVSGELKQWHKVTLTLDGPYAHEKDQNPNPFTDVAMSVAFTHESGAPRYVVPGYFAADGRAANEAMAVGPDGATTGAFGLQPASAKNATHSPALRFMSPPVKLKENTVRQASHIT